MFVSDVFLETPLVLVSLRADGARKLGLFAASIAQMFQQVAFVREDTAAPLTGKLRQANGGARREARTPRRTWKLQCNINNTDKNKNANKKNTVEEEEVR